MARVFANRAFDMDDIDFSWLGLHSQFSARIDAPFTVGGITYADRVTAVHDDGSGSTIFASLGFDVDPVTQAAKGHITGLFQSSNAGPSGIQVGLQGISITVTELDRAITSFSRGDDVRLLARELSGADRFALSSGDDLARGFAGRDLMDGRGGADRLYGGQDRDELRGGGGDDRLFGGEEADALFGEDGVDRLFGGDGQDRLIGGAGADALDGGAGDGDADRFVFQRRSDSPVGGGHDTIHAFETGDRIDLSGIDARSDTQADEGFLWSRQTAANHSVWWTTDSRGVVLQGDIDGDATADFEIVAADLTSLRFGDVIL